MTRKPRKLEAELFRAWRRHTRAIIRKACVRGAPLPPKYEAERSAYWEAGWSRLMSRLVNEVRLNERSRRSGQRLIFGE